MNSTFFTLPEDFNMDDSETLIYFYSNNHSSVKNKVVFTKNMICLLQHGTKEVQTLEGKEIITNKDVLLLTSGSTLMSESVAEGNRYEAIIIFFGNDTLYHFNQKHPLTLEQNPAKNPLFKINRDEYLHNYCQSLELLKQEKNGEIANLKVQEILHYLYLRYPHVFDHFTRQAFTEKKDVKLKQIVELNSNKSLTIEELAFLCNMSTSTFKRHFYHAYNETPKRYFTRLKMEQAKKLLFLKNRPSEIFLQLGYENLSAFSKEFKKYSGKSPKQYQVENEQLETVFERLE